MSPPQRGSGSTCQTYDLGHHTPTSWSLSFLICGANLCPVPGSMLGINYQMHGEPRVAWPTQCHALSGRKCLTFTIAYILVILRNGAGEGRRISVSCRELGVSRETSLSGFPHGRSQIHVTTQFHLLFFRATSCSPSRPPRRTSSLPSFISSWVFSYQACTAQRGC